LKALKRIRAQYPVTKRQTKADKEDSAVFDAMSESELIEFLEKWDSESSNTVDYDLLTCEQLTELISVKLRSP
jgi:hypothetical protein